MNVELAQRDGIARMTVEGEVDVLTAPDFRRGLEQALEMADSGVDVDLSGATFFGSEGVNALARALKQANERGLRLQVCNPSRIAARVLQITGLAEALGVTSRA